MVQLNEYLQTKFFQYLLLSFIKINGLFVTVLCVVKRLNEYMHSCLQVVLIKIILKNKHYRMSLPCIRRFNIFAAIKLYFYIEWLNHDK